MTDNTGTTTVVDKDVSGPLSNYFGALAKTQYVVSEEVTVLSEAEEGPPSAKIKGQCGIGSHSFDPATNTCEICGASLDEVRRGGDY